MEFRTEDFARGILEKERLGPEELSVRRLEAFGEELERLRTKVELRAHAVAAGHEVRLGDGQDLEGGRRHGRAVPFVEGLGEAVRDVRAVVDGLLGVGNVLVAGSAVRRLPVRLAVGVDLVLHLVSSAIR